MSDDHKIEMKPIPERFLQPTPLRECCYCHEKKPLIDFLRPMRNGWWNQGWACVSCLEQRRLTGKLVSRTHQHSRQGITARTRYLVFKRDTYRCQICGATASDGARLHIDHKIPVSKGGTGHISNLWVLCEPCNLGKGDLDL